MESRWTRRGRLRARQTPGGRAHELSGSEAAADIDRNVSRAAQLPGRRADRALQVLGGGCRQALIGSSAVQVGHVTRPATHHMATGRREPVELVARRPSTMSATTLWASGWVGWLQDASRGLPQKEEASRAPRLVADVLFAAGVLPPYGRPRPWPRASENRRSMRTLGVLSRNAVAPCARAMQAPTLEVCRASGQRRSSCSSVTVLTARLGWAAPLQWRLRAARFWHVAIVFVSSRVARRVEGCREVYRPELPSSPRSYHQHD